MNIIKVETNDKMEQVVSGRDLHEKLEIGTPFKKWIDRMCDYGFVENTDFVTVDKNVYGKNGQLMPQKEVEYILTLEMAKQLCMLARNEKGMEFRRYFVEVEKSKVPNISKFKMADFGFINDLKGVENVSVNGKTIPSYQCWVDMIKRCYNKKYRAYKTYGGDGCNICEEWKLFSNFKKWFDANYREGLTLDKDIIDPLNKLYCPEKCMFVTKSENSREMLSRRDNEQFKGENHPMFGMTGEKNHNSKPKEYYESKSKQRNGFKEICKNQGWNFEDFEEIEAEWYYRPDGTRQRKYFYKLKDTKSVN